MDLWELEQRQQVDPEEVRQALLEAKGTVLDWRTRQLASEFRAVLEGDTVERPYFPYLAKQVRPLTRPENIRAFLHDVGREVGHPVRVVVGGSSALILLGLLQRSTRDVVVVDEVPPPLRQLGDRLRGLQSLHRLELAHFQSHYLPAGWESRVQSLGDFGRLRVELVDPVDIFLGKLLSRREKDCEDLRYLFPQFDLALLKERLVTLEPHLRDPHLREKADRNWAVLTGEALSGG